MNIRKYFKKREVLDRLEEQGKGYRNLLRQYVGFNLLDDEKYIDRAEKIVFYIDCIETAIRRIRNLK